MAVMKAKGAATITTVLLLWLVGSVSSYHPNYIAYFNEFSPNRLNLYTKLADSNLDWGQDEGRLQAYLAAHADKKSA